MPRKLRLVKHVSYEELVEMYKSEKDSETKEKTSSNQTLLRRIEEGKEGRKEAKTAERGVGEDS